jgi:putative transposase
MAHSNTIFHELLQLLDRHDFSKIERNGFQPKRKYRTLNRWSQFVVMMFAQITGRCSLRDIADQFQFQAARLYHLGASVVKRSTLADANNKRPAAFFERLFGYQYAKCAAFAPRKKFRFKNKLYSFDASVVDLCLSLFPWAKFRTTKGGIKLHALLDHDGYIPAFIKITTAKVADLTVAKTLKLPPFSIVAMDRAYVDFAWFNKLNDKPVFFVTRMKKAIKFHVVKRRKVIKAKGLSSDQSIVLTGTKAKDCPIQLRRVGYRDPETGQHYVFLTNIFLC